MSTTRRGLLAATAGVAILGGGQRPAAAQTAASSGLRPNKPFAGRRINVLAVVTPQFEALMLRTPEFTELTGIEVRWDFIPFAALQEKIASTGVAADGSYDVVITWTPGGRPTPTGSSGSTPGSSATASPWTATPRRSPRAPLSGAK